MLVASVMPDTLTGVVRVVVVPSPSRPEPFEPQHIRLPSVSRAQEWILPTAMLVAVVMPETSTGAVRAMVVPSPSWPLPFLPQHFTFPFDNRAHE